MVVPPFDARAGGNGNEVSRSPACNVSSGGTLVGDASDALNECTPQMEKNSARSEASLS